MAKLRHKRDRIANILAICPHTGGRMDRWRLLAPSDAGPRGRLWVEDNDLYLAGGNGRRNGKFQAMVPRHYALELHRDHTVDSSELTARFLVNGSPLGTIVGRLDPRVRQETQEGPRS
jgi:hypothetical protein